MTFGTLIVFFLSRRDSRRNYWKDLTTEQSLDTYSRDVGQVITIYIRGASKENHTYKLPITPAGREDAKHLQDALVKGDPEWESLHNLMRRLWDLPKPNLMGSSVYSICYTSIHWSY
jgi:hypothetical protein